MRSPAADQSAFRSCSRARDARRAGVARLALGRPACRNPRTQPLEKLADASTILVRHHIESESGPGLMSTAAHLPEEYEPEWLLVRLKALRALPRHAADGTEPTGRLSTTRN